MESKIRSIILSMLLLLFFQCATEDSNSQYVPPSTTEITHANDQYLYDSNGVSLFERYGTATLGGGMITLSLQRRGRHLLMQILLSQ